MVGQENSVRSSCVYTRSHHARLHSWPHNTAYYDADRPSLGVRQTVIKAQTVSKAPQLSSACRCDLQSINGTQLVLTKPVGQAKGVVLLFHGCQHSALDWGYASPSCPLCLGRPSASVASAAFNDLVRVCYTWPGLRPSPSNCPWCRISHSMLQQLCSWPSTHCGKALFVVAATHMSTECPAWLS